MKNKRNIYVLVLILSIFIILSLSFLNYFKDKKPKIDYSTKEKIATTKSEPKNKEGSVLIEEDSTKTDVNHIYVSLVVLDKNYYVEVEEGVSVYDVMKSAQNNGFSFKGREYPTLGFFVDEINGIKAGQDKYWIYYVNDKEASVGVSKYIIKKGDIINWKLE